MDAYQLHYMSDEQRWREVKVRQRAIVDCPCDSGPICGTCCDLLVDIGEIVDAALAAIDGPNQ